MKTFPNSFFVNVKSKKRLLFLIEHFNRTNLSVEQYLHGLDGYKENFCVRLMNTTANYYIIGFSHRTFYTVYNEYPEVKFSALYKYAMAYEIIEAVKEAYKASNT